MRFIKGIRNYNSLCFLFLFCFSFSLYIYIFFGVFLFNAQPNSYFLFLLYVLLLTELTINIVDFDRVTVGSMRPLT